MGGSFPLDDWGEIELREGGVAISLAKEIHDLPDLNGLLVYPAHEIEAIAENATGNVCNGSLQPLRSDEILCAQPDLDPRTSG